MPDIHEKARRERRVFDEFIKRSGLPVILGTVETRHPPEPDIRCQVVMAGFVAFELVEICDETIAKTVNDQLKQTDPEPIYMRLGNPVRRILMNKRDKTYRTPYPIDLLVYTAGRTILPPDRIVFAIKQILGHRRSPYRRVWFMGEPAELCECLIEL